LPENGAEVMIAEARGISSVLDELTSAEAARLLCAAITTYNALFATPACAAEIWSRCRALSDLGIWASSLRGIWDSVLAIGRGRDKEKLAKDLGAHLYIDTPPRMPLRS
jgi:D-arabinose 1-dehydrogenase-like Zn-dependent alcohol dehydrogenase